MKKFIPFKAIILSLTLILMVSYSFAQDYRPCPMQSFAVEKNQYSKTKINNDEKGFSSVLFRFQLTVGGEVAVETDGTFIYTAAWQNDNLIRKYNKQGQKLDSFLISGVTASIRDLAYDGTFFYGRAATAANKIYKMNFSNKTLVSTITTTGNVRHLSYDPNLDGGNGGFWVGDWASLQKIKKDGTVIATSSAVIADVYGSAYDNISAGGPYLWLFAQTGTPEITLQQFKISTETLTGVNYHLGSIAGVSSDALAGGLASSSTLISGKFILLANSQQEPNLLLGLDFTDYQNDAGISNITPNGAGSTCNSGNENIVVQLKNYGINNLNSAVINWNINGVDKTPYNWSGSLSINSSTNVTIGNYNFSTPMNYVIKASTSLPNGMADGNSLNDTLYTNYSIASLLDKITQNFDALITPALPLNWTRETNSVAWSTVVGGSGNPAQPPAHSTPNMIITYYNSNNSTIPKNDWFFTSALGLSMNETYKLTFWYDAPGYNGLKEKMRVTLGTTPTVVGVIDTLWENTSMSTTAGVYKKVEINFTPTTNNCFYLGWQAFSAADINYISVDDISLEISTATKDVTNDEVVKIYPNPTCGKIFIVINKNSNIYIINLLGKRIASEENVSGLFSFDLSNQAQGIYFITVVQGKNLITEKIILSN